MFTCRAIVRERKGDRKIKRTYRKKGRHRHTHIKAHTDTWESDAKWEREIESEIDRKERAVGRKINVKQDSLEINEESSTRLE